MTKEDHAIQGSPVRFASFGPTEWLFVHGGILIAWALVLASTILLPPVWGALWAVVLSALPVLVHVWWPAHRGRRDKLIALRAVPLAGLRYWIPAGLLLFPVISLATIMALHQLTPLPEPAPDIFTTYQEKGGGVALGILVILAIPIIEEFVFRGWLLRALEHRLSPITAVTISAALFALVHGLPEALHVHFGIGILFGWAVWQSGSVWAGVLLHSSYNGSLIAGDALIRMVETARGAELELSTTVVSLLLTLSAALLVTLVMLGRRAAREKSAPRGL